MMLSIRHENTSRVSSWSCREACADWVLPCALTWQLLLRACPCLSIADTSVRAAVSGCIDSLACKTSGGIYAHSKDVQLVLQGSLCCLSAALGAGELPLQRARPRLSIACAAVCSLRLICAAHNSLPARTLRCALWLAGRAVCTSCANTGRQPLLHSNDTCRYNEGCLG